MPYEDDEMRRVARERLEARMQRRGSAGNLASNAARRAQERERVNEVAAQERRPRRQNPRPVSSVGQQPKLYTNPPKSRPLNIGPLSLEIPGSIPPIAIPIAAAILVLLLLFVVIIPSCHRASEQPSGESASQSAAATQASSASASATQASSGSASATQASSGNEASSGAAAASQTSASTPASTTASGIFLKAKLAKDRALQTLQEASQIQGLDRSETHQGALATLLGDESSAKLLAQAKTNVDALWIAAHPGVFALDGVEVQYKILKLAADEPAALEYIRDFPKMYPAKKVDEDSSIGMSPASPSAGAPDTDVPHLYQWDRRWGYTTYSSAAFGLTGCGPTSLAMVYQGVTGKTDKNPYDMGKLADEGGYMSEYEGTVGTFFTEVAESLGLQCEELYPDSESLRDALKRGQVVIINLAPGYFTNTGHYLVATDLASDGKVIINDPYSVERSSQTWDPDLLTAESYVMYGYSKGSGSSSAKQNSDQGESSAQGGDSGEGSYAEGEDASEYYDATEDYATDESYTEEEYAEGGEEETAA